MLDLPFKNPTCFDTFMAISLFSAFNSETQPLNPGFELCCERLWKGRPMGCLPAGIVPLGTGSWRARTFLRFNCNAGYKIPMMIPVWRLLELATKELALDLLQQAWQLKLEVNTVTYNAAISACERLVCAWSFQKSASTWSSWSSFSIQFLWPICSPKDRMMIGWCHQPIPC